MLTERDIKRFNRRRRGALLRHGFPKDQLWLTECELTKDGRGIVYLHESGDTLTHAFFTDEASFEAACRYVGSYFTPR